MSGICLTPCLALPRLECVLNVKIMPWVLCQISFWPKPGLLGEYITHAEVPKDKLRMVGCVPSQHLNTLLPPLPPFTELRECSQILGPLTSMDAINFTPEPAGLIQENLQTCPEPYLQWQQKTATSLAHSNDCDSPCTLF